ncbi:aminopeptidase N-like [Branchiostoma floridae]|uniref:Aminopeptidase n=1 Tax=Branchiostoma floridae TaxID=7739 RepID=A0A9J7HJX2_BRAFL|nr:aminopeptidase N-like [Branchiostoma floridae]
MNKIVELLLMLCLLPLLRNVGCDVFERQALADISHSLDDLEEVEEMLAWKREEQILQSTRLPNNVIPLHYDLRLEVDLQEFVVLGRVTVTVRCQVPTSYILLHASDKLEIVGGDSQPILQGQDGDASPTIISWSLHSENDFLLLKLDGELTKDGVYNLKIHFRNVLSDHQFGLYRSSYINKNKQKRYLVTTHFEPTGARKAFPCFDEPALKATFKVTLIHQAEYQAMSNMPVERSVKREDGWVKDHFMTSPKMATYLFAFVVSDLTSVGLKTRSGIEINVSARPSAIAEGKGAYSLGISEKILTYFGDYLGVSYPLPKLDLAAIPDFPMGGMENWGLIMFEETALLYDAEAPSAKAKQKVSHVVSHELAHMWFGDLVTMKWWDGIWLNEGITSYFERLGADFAEPDLKVLDLLTCEVRAAMEKDSLASSRPVYQPVHRTSEIGELFDDITYLKGASLMRMLHHSVGENIFRKAFQNYLQNNAYSSTIQEQLWEEFTQALAQDGQSDLNVKSMMDTWTLQMGYPVVTFTRDYSSGKMDVTQQHFLKDASASSNVPDSKFGGQRFSHYLDTKVIDLEGAGTEDWILGNVEQVGFYRVNYDTKNWRLLINHLRSDRFQDIPAVNRGTLVDDALNLASASMLDITVALDLSQYLVRERSHVAWELAKSALGYISDILSSGTDVYKKWQDYMVHLITLFYNDVSWTDEELTFQEEMGQVVAVDIACENGQHDCVARAKALFARWMDTNDNSHIPERLKKTVYCTAIEYGGKAQWEFGWQRYQQGDTTEQLYLLSALACTKDMDILKMYLEKSKDKSQIRQQYAADVIQGIADKKAGKSVAWEFFVDNWEDFYFKSFNENGALPSIVEKIPQHFCTDKDLENLLLFTKDRDLGTAARTFQQAVESTQANIRWRQNNLDKVQKWLEEKTLST